jgi:DNA-binding NarL/FixJ family response regulator
VVLADLQLTGCGGAETVRALRAVNPAVPLAVVTANEDAEVMHACMAAGANAFVRKSAGMPELREAIARLTAQVLPSAQAACGESER